MNSLFYPRFAAQNIRKEKKFYFPYILTCILSVSMYFIINSLSSCRGIKNIYGGEQLQIIMKWGMWVAAIFFAIFIFYTNSFLMKRRKKQFGVYSVLGMEKKHLCLMSFYETVYIMIISLVSGILLGMLLSKLGYLLLMKIVDCRDKLGIVFTAGSIMKTTALFIVVFLLVFLKSVWQVNKYNVIDLLKGENTGEKEPKTKWLIALIGIISLASGYCISILTKNPVNSIPLFILAVILVMIGTYCLFTAGSIAFLKILRRRKNYYYKAKHFSSVAGMMYRMKQNAVGLGNICIICTAILVMLSTTVSLYASLNDFVNKRCPQDFAVSSSNMARENINKVKPLVKKTAESENVSMSDVKMKVYREMYVDKEGKSLKASGQGFGGNTFLKCMTLDDFNEISHIDCKLSDNEIMLYVCAGNFSGSTMKIADNDYKIVNHPDNYKFKNDDFTAMPNYYVMIVPGQEQINKITTALNVDKTKIYNNDGYEYELLFNSNLEGKSQKEFSETLSKQLESMGLSSDIISKYQINNEVHSIFGGMLFLGTFLGFVFMIAAVLIIYYKQISEGYDDKERFKIMQQVGMSLKEVKKTIHSQVITVFFLPIVTAFIHLAFSYPIIKRIMKCLSFTNTHIFITVLILSSLLLLLIYSVVYWITSKAYYKIVKE